MLTVVSVLQRAITCNMGMKMPGWYDIYSFEGLNSKEDEVGVNASSKFVKQLIDQEVDAGTPVSRIVVAGFSQGGAVALMSLRQIEGLAGVVGVHLFWKLFLVYVILCNVRNHRMAFVCRKQPQFTMA